MLGSATTQRGVAPTDDMASDRTFITEIATGLGMLGADDLGSVIARRPAEMSNLTSEHWRHLTKLWDSRLFSRDFEAGFANGQAFLVARDALNGRRPRIVEWTGGRRAPGDEVVPSDLRIDHVYLVSCKYLSRILHNPSPARLVEGLLSNVPVDNARDWYERVAPAEYQALYEACLPTVEGLPLPALAKDLSRLQRKRLVLALRQGWPPFAADQYLRLSQAVARRTAEAWSARVSARNQEPVLWRLLRIGSAPYFILGSSERGSMRLRIDTPWDWRQIFQLRTIDIEPQAGGQPRVGWKATYVVARSSSIRSVRGHVEIRWSHGRFGQPPEAKVYLDDPHEQVPGYHPL